MNLGTATVTFTGQPKIKMPGANAVFAFVDFFQWNQYDYLSMSSVHCKVIECEKTDLVGRQALIESQYVDSSFTIPKQVAPQAHAPSPGRREEEINWRLTCFGEGEDALRDVVGAKKIDVTYISWIPT